MKHKIERRNTKESVDELKELNQTPAPQFEKEDAKVSTALSNLATDKQDNTSMGQRVYSVPSIDKMKRSKIAQKTGQVPSSINIYGSHYPVVRLLNDNTVVLHTSPYGNDGKTNELLEKIKADLPNHFPNAKVIHVHHPDYRHSAKVMRMKDPKNITEYLKHAAEKHPDEAYRQHASDAVNHLSSLKKAEYGKPIHSKRIESEGFDYDKNLNNRLGKLHGYLTSIGLTPELTEGGKRNLGASNPASFSINLEGDPYDQQVLHEAGHAMLTSPNQTISEYQKEIGQPGFLGKLTQTRNKEHLKQTHGGGMPEQTAQHMEAGIARRAGIEPFRSPKRGKEGTGEELARTHAKKTLQDFDEGFYRFDPFSGEKELIANPNTMINAKARGDKPLMSAIREKFLAQRMKNKKLQNQKLAANENIEPDLTKGSLQRKMGNPKKMVTEKERYRAAEWSSGFGDRENVPEASPEAKKRFFQKLHAQTEVRRHPKTGERMFLMHRGEAPDDPQMHKRTMTSWTPKYNIAKDFAYDYNHQSETGNDDVIHSAWIPESAIHNYIPNATVDKDYKENLAEQEYLVQPHKFIYAKKQESKESEKYDKLAASEKM